jgi:hypothetical protein
MRGIFALASLSVGARGSRARSGLPGLRGRAGASFFVSAAMGLVSLMGSRSVSRLGGLGPRRRPVSAGRGLGVGGCIANRGPRSLGALGDLAPFAAPLGSTFFGLALALLGAFGGLGLGSRERRVQLIEEAALSAIRIGLLPGLSPLGSGVSAWTRGLLRRVEVGGFRSALFWRGLHCPWIKSLGGGLGAFSHGSSLYTPEPSPTICARPLRALASQGMASPSHQSNSKTQDHLPRLAG